MASPSVKILTVGAARGSIRDLFTKVNAIDAKHGKFDLILCTGDFFGPPKVGEEYGEDDEVIQLLNGSLEAPVECYIMQGEHPLPSPVIEKFAKTGGALNEKVFLLHKSGVMTTAHGLRIACLGGMYEPNMYSAAAAIHGFVSPYFTTQTVDKLIANTMTQSAPSSKSKDTSYTSLASIKANTSTSYLLDILLTNTFPMGITALSNVPLPSPAFSTGLEAEAVADLVRRTKPRYHLAVGAASGKEQVPSYWEREPFMWDGENGRFTRFISLGAFGGEAAPSSGKKQRWFYAFSITPSAPNELAAPRPANATGNPLTEGVHRSLKRPIEDEGENYRWGNVKQGAKKAKADGSQGQPPAGYKCKICESTEHFINDCPDRAKPKEGYICKICHEPGHFVRDCPTKHQVGDTGGRKPREGYVCRACGSELHYIQDCSSASSQSHGHGPRGRPKEIAPDECWFCLSNPKLAKHLIVSIGSECYVTLPKGQIIPTHSQSTFPQGKMPAVPGGGHVLIVPITHYPTYATIPPDLSGPIVEETRKYKSALWAFYAKHAAHPVSFEVGRLSAKGGHAHVQVVPVPQSVSADTIAKTFTSEGERLGIDFETEETEREGVTGDRGYFRVELPDGKKLVHWMKDGVPFSIQFGRQVLVGLLGIPERFDWRECTQSDDQDRQDAQAFKAAFRHFDPTM